MMNKMILIILLSIVVNACAFNLEQESYNFDNFKDTPLWELAKAVRNDDAATVHEILKSEKLDIDLKDPLFQQTMLALAIQNKKKNATIALLDQGANPNKLIGSPEDATPFIYAIENVEDCDLFFVKELLAHGANVNLEIAGTKTDYFSAHNNYPLFAAIGNSNNNGSECLELIKLLVENGANINYCPKRSLSGICEGAIYQTLITNSIVTLRYLVIDKKITVPDVVLIEGGINPATQKKYSLQEILNTDDYNFDMPNNADLRNSKDEILRYLKTTKTTH